MKKADKNKDDGRTRFSRKKMLSALFFILLAAVLGFLWHRCHRDGEQDERRFEQLQEEMRSTGVDGLKKRYKDMVGWIEIKGTEFSYPVMQTKNDPEYYLHRDEKGQYSFYGTPFLDARCSQDSDNLLIYGHNINGRRHFGYLQYFREKSFYEKHKTLCYTKVGGTEEEYPIVAVVKTDVSSDYFRYADIYNDEEYRSLAKKILSESLYRCEWADVLERDMKKDTVEEFFHKYQFLTLCTCRTGEGKDKRLLVIGCRKRNTPVPAEMAGHGDGKEAETT